MKNLFLSLSIFFFYSSVLGQITYKSTHLTDTSEGSLWRIDYTLSKSLSFDAGMGFSIFFDRGLSRNLAITGSIPIDWDEIVVQPDLALSSDGFFDAEANINNASIIGTFSVNFLWLGGAIDSQPFAQHFEIYDSSFTTLLSGTTQTMSAPSAVPEPSTIYSTLIFCTILTVVISRRKK